MLQATKRKKQKKLQEKKKNQLPLVDEEAQKMTYADMSMHRSLMAKVVKKDKANRGRVRKFSSRKTGQFGLGLEAGNDHQERQGSRTAFFSLASWPPGLHPWPPPCPLPGLPAAPLHKRRKETIPCELAPVTALNAEHAPSEP